MILPETTKEVTVEWVKENHDIESKREYVNSHRGASFYIDNSIKTPLEVSSLEELERLRRDLVNKRISEFKRTLKKEYSGYQVEVKFYPETDNVRIYLKQKESDRQVIDRLVRETKAAVAKRNRLRKSIEKNKRDLAELEENLK